MGIPSYFKRLIEKHPHILRSSITGPVASLLVDFNCLIYHCARKPTEKGGLPAFPTYDAPEEAIYEWEGWLIQSVLAYVQKLWSIAGKPHEVVLALDGVVPMAKIRQQRLRRFKSVWINQELGSASTAWDSNCITPGTAFMERLGKTLADYCISHNKRGGKWILSSTEEAGEGEHKLMQRLRCTEGQKKVGAYCIYGLDADLILLSMLNGYGDQKNCPVYLFREEVEFGKVSLDNLGEEKYCYLDIGAYVDTMWPPSGSGSSSGSSSGGATAAKIRQYVAAMSLLGNDFLPHSLSIKIREDGHLQLLEDLNEMEKCGYSLLDLDNEGCWAFQRDALFWLFCRWAQKEARGIEKGLRRKLMMKPSINGPEDELQNKPLQWSVEKSIFVYRDGKSYLRNDWPEYYNREWLGRERISDVSQLCEDYLRGLQWILDYYTGQRPVPLFWYYPLPLPPLWKDLAAACKNLESTFLSPPSNGDGQERHLKPVEQLAMVLPLSSWHLLPASAGNALRRLPCQYPHFWPIRYEFFSVGRRWLWECEPILPLLSVSKLPLRNEKSSLDG